MKINRTVLSMALGGAMLPLGIATAQDSPNLPRPLSSVGKIGDSPRSIGDTDDGEASIAYREDNRPEAFRENVVDPSKPATPVSPRVGSGVLYSDASYSPAMEHPNYSLASQATPTPHASTVYQSVTGSSSHDFSSYAGPSGSNGWANVESLLWWTPGSKTPPLAATAPAFGPADTFTNRIGGENNPLATNLFVGLRADVGIWLDDYQSTGVGGRAFGIFNGDQSQTVTSPGTPLLGIPFYDTLGDSANIFLVATPGNLAGSIKVDTQLSFIASDLYGKFLLARSGSSRADVVAGYSFLRFDDGINISTTSTSIPPATTLTTIDRFGAKNTFHGGHLGFTTDINRGRWTFSTLSKVALGNMHQERQVSGLTTLTGAPNTPRGILAQTSNIGTSSRDVFTFIPEGSAKIRYCLNRNWQFNLGYSVLFLPDVALAGGMIDPTLNPQNIADPVNFPNTIPAQRFPHDIFYLHGIDLGLTYEF